ncbi:MAG: DUF1385 domain-containing protein [Clostridia bacterium]|nr:DUF1385 domain-containing protein [Clostridia bacterium]MBO4797831.1 DUF1385 domain-containing protein [Candidatus Methanomethylophilaceae archaeon]MBQ4290688.1 DUF1385 domain-containing protein [Clostridia bacterium]
MAKKKDTELLCGRRGKIGGEALIEGIMMKAGRQYAVAVRQPDKRIRVSLDSFQTVRDRFRLLRIPIVRGAVNMVETLILSYRVLGLSAEVFGDTGEEQTKFEKWVEKKFGKSILNVIMGISTVLGLLLGIGLFFFLPMAATKGLEALFGGSIGWFKNLAEGLIRIGIFVLYIWAVSFMPDIRRTFQYHGAEHKTIFCYEKELPLTVENIAAQKRFHPRCGTSFLFVALIVSVVISSFITWDNIWLRQGIKLLLLPLTVGLSFELIMYAGKHDNLLTRILSAPGLWMQRLTTREPDAEMIEVAIASVKTVLSDEYPDFETDSVEGESYRIVREPRAEETEKDSADESGPAEERGQEAEDASTCAGQN